MVEDTSLFADNRERLCSALKSSGVQGKGDVVLLSGGSEVSVYSSDTSYVFRQVGSNLSS